MSEHPAELERMRERITSGNCGEDDAWIVDEVAAWRERFPDLSAPVTRHHTTADTLAAEDRVRAEDGHLGGRA